MNIFAPIVISDAGIFNTYERLLPPEARALPGKSPLCSAGFNWDQGTDPLSAPTISECRGNSFPDSGKAQCNLLGTAGIQKRSTGITERG